jgi:glycosyltransferase involved in cell wall biosynthesis
LAPGDQVLHPQRRGVRRSILVWQWGRHGAGPLIAARLASALRLMVATDSFLSLSTNADIFGSEMAIPCALPVTTYGGIAGLVWRSLQIPLVLVDLVRRIRALSPNVAVCAMPGPLDLICVMALRLCHIPVVVMVHDADRHSGDNYPLLMTLQRQLIKRADSVVTFSNHVAERLVEQGLCNAGHSFTLRLPPLIQGPQVSPPRAHGGPLRLLFFGRLRKYKGLGLLQTALAEVGEPDKWMLRVVGFGPESSELEALRATAGVVVENRWVPDSEIAELIGWSDAVVLPYMESSQSGVAPTAIAAGRFVVGTRVGGLAEQLRDQSLARLCDPEPASLAAVLRQLLYETPSSGYCPRDPKKDWQAFALELVDRVIDPMLRHRVETRRTANTRESG